LIAAGSSNREGSFGRVFVFVLTTLVLVSGRFCAVDSRILTSGHPGLQLAASRGAATGSLGAGWVLSPYTQVWLGERETPERVLDFGFVESAPRGIRVRLRALVPGVTPGVRLGARWLERW